MVNTVVENITDQHNYLIFKLFEIYYAIDAELVQEIMELPALKCMADMPNGVAGFVNVKGTITQVLDMQQCFEYDPNRLYKTTEALVLLKNNDLFFGIIISEILDIKNLPIAVSYHGAKEMIEQKHPAFAAISGVTRLEQEIVFVLDPFVLFHHIKAGGSEHRPIDSSSYKGFNINPQDRPLFQERAQRCKEIVGIKETRDGTPYVIMILNKEYFGIEAVIVEEFCDQATFTPIPGAEMHILGFMNLRGDVLPLIDIWPAIQSQNLTIMPLSQIIVVSYQGAHVGILVDSIVDIIFFNESSFRPVPLGVKSFREDLTKSTVLHNNEVLAILDLNKILKSLQVSQNTLS